MNSHKLLYLHGFNSSPESYKARALQAAMQEKGLEQYVEIPEIPPVPARAIEMLVDRVNHSRKSHKVAFAGSSLGGFYATWLAERFGGKAVLINPAVCPHELLEKYLGENINYYTSEHWILNESHIQQFRELDVECITQPERYLVMLQTGDETLDYRHAVEKYEGCNIEIEEGGDHAFVDFESHIDSLLRFCEITY
jgi:predicted esterase YcpF (UPF0227 family)